MSPTETVSTLKLGTPPKGHATVPPDQVLPEWKPRDLGPLVQEPSLLHQITHLPNSGATALPSDSVSPWSRFLLHPLWDPSEQDKDWGGYAD